MAALQELLACCERLAALEAELNVLDSKANALCTNGHNAAWSDVNTLVEKCEHQKLQVYSKFQEQLKSLIKAALRAASFSEHSCMMKLLDLQEQYFTMVSWLCKRWVINAEGKQMTCLELFQRDHPGAKIWDCND